MIDNPYIVVFDVETPNCKNDSICSIGMIIIQGNKIVDKFYSLVNPEDSFDPYNIRIHGITEKSVLNAPTFPELWEEIKDYFSKYLLVGHNVVFDLSCIKKCLHKYGIEALPPYYVDTLDLANEYVDGVENYKLITLCEHFDIILDNYHNALDDSSATADLFFRIIDDYNFDLNEYIKKYDFNHIKKNSDYNYNRKSPFNEISKSLQELQGVLIGVTSDDVLNDKEVYAIKRWVDSHANLKGNYPFDRIYYSLKKVLEDNLISESERTELLNIFNSIINPVASNAVCECDLQISGKKICLTGDFDCMSRDELSSKLEECGAIIKNSVVKTLDYLVVGNKGSSQWTQGNYGTKVKKAMEFNDKGCNIQIIKEDDFLTSIEI